MSKYAYHQVDGNAEGLYTYAKRLGLRVVKIGRPVDALVGQYRILVPVEVKTLKGKLTDGQANFIAEFGGFVWREKADVLLTATAIHAMAEKLGRIR